MKNNKSIIKIGTSVKRTESYDFTAYHISSNGVGTDLDPVISIDHFKMRGPTFPPHPHAGFSAITYLLEDGEGEFISRDSGGNMHTAKPGGIIWNATGSGVIHEEYPNVSGELSHGLQMFINLSKENKLKPPKTYFADAPEIPVIQHEGVRTRVITGKLGGTEASINPPGNVTLLDVQLEAHKTFSEEFNSSDKILLYVIRGTAAINEQKTKISEHGVAVFGDDGTHLSIRAGEEGAHVVLIAGKPLDEPIVAGGPFVMNTQDQISDAFKSYRNGTMGHLETANDY